MSESEAVDTTVTLVVGCSVVQEAANASTTSTMRINYHSKTVKLADGVDARGPDSGLAILSIP